MTELVVQGPDTRHAWRQVLTEGETVRIGRSVATGFSVPWDRMISREHADLCLRDGVLHISCLERALNPIEYKGVACRSLDIEPGETFVIGETSFTLDPQLRTTHAETTIQEHRFSRDALSSREFRDAEARLQVLTDLPDVVSCATSDDDFAEAMARLLLAGVTRATTTAVLHLNATDELNLHAPTTLRWTSRLPTVRGFTPSRRLVRAALKHDDSMLHVWADDAADEHQYTMVGGHDWAFCTPVRGAASHGWCLYATGTRSSAETCADDLAGDVRFAELLAELTSSIRDVRALERQHAGMARFFSPTVTRLLNTRDAPARLEPRECDVTVMFCDLRGFSRLSEEGRHDLRALLDRSAEALGVMTAAVLDEDGVIADFQGDAVLGFWGWPVDQDDRSLPAVRAAMRIARTFAEARQDDAHPLAGMNIGIGIAHGRGLAGRIGTKDQQKVGVFGPVVNLGARLESLTKHVGVSILAESDAVCEAACAIASIRRVARVRPYGMTRDVELCAVESREGDTRSFTSIFVEAREHFDAGRWDEARARLDDLPPTDGPRAFLDGWMRRLGVPPADWTGVIVMDGK